MVSKTSFGRILFAALMGILWACNSSTPTTGEHIEHYQNGAISRRAQLVNGQKEGIMTDYYPGGEKMADRLFHNGKQEGKTMIYYPSGKLKEVQHFHEGSQQQGDTIWYENGQIQFSVFFINNKKNGYLRKWSPEGELVFESKYAMDTLIEVKGQPIPRQSIEERSLSDTLIRPKKQR